MNRFTGMDHGAEVLLAGVAPGDIEPVEIRKGGLMVQRGGLLACGGGVRSRGSWAGVPMALTGEGGYFLRCSGEGVVLVNGYGAIDLVGAGRG